LQTTVSFGNIMRPLIRKGKRQLRLPRCSLLQLVALFPNRYPDRAAQDFGALGNTAGDRNMGTSRRHSGAGADIGPAGTIFALVASPYQQPHGIGDGSADGHSAVTEAGGVGIDAADCDRGASGQQGRGKYNDGVPHGFADASKRTTGFSREGPKI